MEFAFEGVAGKVQGVNSYDDDGNPAGGYVTGTGLTINWQDGPLGKGEDREEANGAFVEDVIQGCIERMKFYQDSRFSCLENQVTLDYLEKALNWQKKRTRDREKRGVEGTHAR